MTAFMKLSIFNLICLIVIGVLLFLCKKFIKERRTHDLILKTTSILVILIHYSAVYVEFFQNQGVAYASASYILPVYPCHIMMWLLVIVAFTRHKKSRFFEGLAEFVFVVGTLAALIGALFNMNFLNSSNPTFTNYFLFKGVFGHMVMFFGTTYLFVFEYVKPRVEKTMISVIVGLLFFVADGIIINTLYAKFDIPPVNAMFLLEPPFEDYPFINFFTIGSIGLILCFIGLLIYEHITLPKAEQWITKISTKSNKQDEDLTTDKTN